MPKSRSQLYNRYLRGREEGHRRSPCLAKDPLTNGRKGVLASAVVERLYRDIRWSEGDDAGCAFTRQMEERKALTSYESAGQTGGIFNLEFNTEGSILAAACEHKSVLLFDPLTRRLVSSIERAHDDCVNCVRFFDSRTFATCSDDCTVALWDSRYLKHKMRSLHGHVNWVKNIEYSRREQYLATSGFDGAVFLWDINRHSEDENRYRRKIFSSSGLMRMRLSPLSGDRMVISTMNGFLMVIHDLDLETLEDDLKGFKPNLYRLMQISRKRMPLHLPFGQLFTARRNRVEFVCDFPEGDDAEVISSLQLHPQGWVAVTRNLSADEESEWCCVHDVHGAPPDESGGGDEAVHDADDEEEEGNADLTPMGRRAYRSAMMRQGPLSRMAEFLYLHMSAELNRRRDARQNAEEDAARDGGGDSEAEENPEGGDVATGEAGRAEGSAAAAAAGRPVITVRVTQDAETGRRTFNIRQEGGDVGAGPSGVMQLLSARASQAIEAAAARAAAAAASSSSSSVSTSAAPRPNQPPGPSSPLQFPQPSPRRMASRPQHPPLAEDKKTGEIDPTSRFRIYGNVPRLTHFLEESNTGKGFIKEISFSHDGRVLCSPFDNGFRLVAFDPHCGDLGSQMALSPSSTERSPSRLVQLEHFRECHPEAVLSSCFSPVGGFTLVTGCKGGKIAWHQPRP